MTVIVDAGAGHRRQRRHLQRRPRRAAPAARQPRRGPADLHPPERARHRRTRTPTFSVPEIQDLREPHQNAERVRRLLDDRLHDGRAGRAARRSAPAWSAAPTSTSWGCIRSRPPAGRERRWPAGGGRGGADVSLLDDLAEERPDGDRQDRAARRRARRPSSASSNRRCRIPRKPRSSRTS